MIDEYCEHCGCSPCADNQKPQKIEEIGFYDYAKTSKIDIKDLDFHVHELHNKLNELIRAHNGRTN